MKCHKCGSELPTPFNYCPNGEGRCMAQPLTASELAKEKRISGLTNAVKAMEDAFDSLGRCDALSEDDRERIGGSTQEGIEHLRHLLRKAKS